MDRPITMVCLAKNTCLQRSLRFWKFPVVSEFLHFSRPNPSIDYIADLPIIHKYDALEDSDRKIGGEVSRLLFEIVDKVIRNVFGIHL